MSQHPPQYVQVSTLPPELQEAAVAYLKNKCGEVGPVTTAGIIVDRKDMLRCGHPVSKVVKDENGVEYCAWCSRL